MPDILCIGGPLDGKYTYERGETFAAPVPPPPNHSRYIMEDVAEIIEFRSAVYRKFVIRSPDRDWPLYAELSLDFNDTMDSLIDGYAKRKLPCP